MTKWLLSIVALLCASLAAAQTAQTFTNAHVYFVDGSGNPCAGCSLYSYAAGTTTAQATYTTSSETVPNPNPIVLDAAGGATIWLGSSPYKFVLLDTFGTTLWTVDQVQTPTQGGTAYLPLTGGTLAGSLTAPYFQFSSPTLQSCTSGQYVSGWTSAGWTCSAPSVGGTAGGDLSGTYPDPTVVQVNGAAIPTSATLVGTNSSNQFIAQTGTISNSTTGNAATATALAAIPTQCSTGQVATGIDASGNANCTTPSGTIISFSFSGCNANASSNIADCTGTVSLPSSFAPSDTDYVLTCTPYITGGANGFITITAQTLTNFSYQIGIMMVNGTTSQPSTVNCYVSNPS